MSLGSEHVAGEYLDAVCAVVMTGPSYGVHRKEMQRVPWMMEMKWT